MTLPILIAAAAAVLAATLTLMLLVRKPPAPAADPALLARLAEVERAARDLPGTVRDEGRASREEIRNAFAAQQQVIETRLTAFADSQTGQLRAMRQEAADAREKLEGALKTATEAAAEVQRVGLAAVAKTIADLIEANEKKQEALREALRVNLEQLRKENGEELEKMRATVDEKLQGTLETRLGESFKLVSDRLEMVHKGLGEMQTLATGVGDLKRVLTNVKSRGGWGEVQLGMLLEDMLTPDQYETNVRIRPESGELVEFAVRLPGKDGDFPVYLPIDAKFPQEDYERLTLAQDAGVAADVERAGQALERAVRTQAKIISEKYVHPPRSTDFAILYLPTEGLFAEIIRRPGLVSDLQRQHRIMVTGPTTLAAVLNSLQMGFRTLAIEKRSSEVWQVLGAAKAEFRKYGDVWDKLGKQLETAQKTVASAGQRTRAVERTLRTVETLEGSIGVDPLAALPDLEGFEPEAESLEEV